MGFKGLIKKINATLQLLSLEVFLSSSLPLAERAVLTWTSDTPVSSQMNIRDGTKPYFFNFSSFERKHAILGLLKNGTVLIPSVDLSFCKQSTEY